MTQVGDNPLPLALIVEDEYDIANIFAKAAQAAGFEASIALDGETALTWLAVHTPTIVILDLRLPGISGEQVLDHIRADQRLTEANVIIATAYTIISQRVQDTADWILTKPIGFAQLRDLAARCIVGTRGPVDD